MYQIQNMINNAPSALDTLLEISASLQSSKYIMRDICLSGNPLVFECDRETEYTFIVYNTLNMYYILTTTGFTNLINQLSYKDFEISLSSIIMCLDAFPDLPQQEKEYWMLKYS